MHNIFYFMRYKLMGHRESCSYIFQPKRGSGMLNDVTSPQCGVICKFIKDIPTGYGAMVRMLYSNYFRFFGLHLHLFIRGTEPANIIFSSI